MMTRSFGIRLSTRGSGIVAGIVTAIGLSEVCQAQMIERMDAPSPPPMWRGIDWQPFPNGLFFDDNGEPIWGPVEERDYPVITGVHPCSPADSAGVRVGDLLIRINGRDAREVPPPFHESKAGVVQELELRRGDEHLRVSVREVPFPTEPITCARTPSANSASPTRDVRREYT